MELLSAGEKKKTIGPSANLFVRNQRIAPDGFSRSAVLARSSSFKLDFPGPLIRGMKGDTFRLNVINDLTDTSMLTSTSIVLASTGLCWWNQLRHFEVLGRTKYRSYDEIRCQ